MIYQHERKKVNNTSGEGRWIAVSSEGRWIAVSSEGRWIAVSGEGRSLISPCTATLIITYSIVLTWVENKSQVNARYLQAYLSINCTPCSLMCTSLI